jgi:hypothetical protein
LIQFYCSFCVNECYFLLHNLRLLCLPELSSSLLCMTIYSIIAAYSYTVAYVLYSCSLSKNAVLLFRSSIGYRGQHPSTLQSDLKIYIQFSYSLNSMHWYYSIACIICITEGHQVEAPKFFKRCRWVLACDFAWVFDVHIIISSININVYLKTPGFRSMSINI